MEKLAIDGGRPIRTAPLPEYRTIGKEEERAVLEVVKTGVLSKYLGAWTPDFYGGPQVQALEKEWAGYFKTPHAVSVNSATSGLYAAIGATGVGPGDEVVVSPYTMSASAACVLGYNAVPVFADIDPDTFCLTAQTIERALSPRTRAVVVVDLFGMPAEFESIMHLARQHDLIVVEDAAQAPGARYKNKFAGTIGDIGVFSLNYHKIIHSGEGGVVVTENDDYAEKIRMIRNHAEVVVDQRKITDLISMLGFNYRMTELEAAIAREQLKKLDHLIRRRWEIAEQLNDGLKNLPGITIPKTNADMKSGYYVYPFKIDADYDRKWFVSAVRAEGIQIYEGYVKPIYLQPLYQQKILYGSTGCPFTCPHYGGNVSYARGICPTTERLYETELLYGDWCHAGLMDKDVDDIIEAVAKVCRNS